MNLDIVRTQMMLLGLSPIQVAKQMGIAPSSVYRWLDGTTKRVPEDNLVKLAEVLHLSVNALKENTKHLVKPILGTVKAGYDMYATEDILGFEEVSELEAKKGDYYLKVTGDSMIGDGIFDGDLVYVRSMSDIDSNSIAVILLGEEVTIKRLIKKDELLILEASNNQVPNRIFNKNEVELLPVRVLGKVIHSKRIFG